MCMRFEFLATDAQVEEFLRDGLFDQPPCENR